MFGCLGVEFRVGGHASVGFRVGGHARWLWPLIVVDKKYFGEDCAS